MNISGICFGAPHHRARHAGCFFGHRPWWAAIALMVRLKFSSGQFYKRFNKNYVVF
jgi:hypothetical protein